jgi:hypothetical protein
VTLPATGTIPSSTSSYTTSGNVTAATGTGAFYTLTANLGGVTSAGGITSTAGRVTSSSPSGGIGYSTGAGIAAVQGTSATTAVVADGLCGTITLHGTQNVAAGAEQVFTFTNTSIEVGDAITVHRRSGGTGGVPLYYVTSVAAGSCVIGMTNLGGTAETGSDLILTFAIVKTVAA